MLFAWARAEVFRHRYGVPMLAPQWIQPKIGPLLRREKDLRYYAGLFTNDGYVTGLKRWAILATTRRIHQRDAEAFMAAQLTANESAPRTIVQFGGWEGWFAGLEQHKPLVSQRLFELMKPAVRESAARQPVDYVIAVHARRGDKPTMQFGEPINDRWDHSKGMPDQWFVNCIKHVRDAIGSPAPVKVFSDAKEHQLHSLLSMENVTLAGDNPSIVDIFRLSKAKVLISTSTSSFSAWATYLGRMPTLWYPGLNWALSPERPGFDIETDLQGNLPVGADEVIRRFVAGLLNE